MRAMSASSLSKKNERSHLVEMPKKSLREIRTARVSPLAQYQDEFLGRVRCGFTTKRGGTAEVDLSSSGTEGFLFFGG